MAGPAEAQVVLQEIRDTLKKAPALNGGFDRLIVTVDFIKEKQEESIAKIDVVHNSLYTPVSGVHSKLQAIEATVSQQGKDMSDLAETVEELVEFKKASEATNTLLKQTAGEKLEHLDAVVKFRNNFDRLYWLLVTGVLTSLGKVFWDLFIKK